MPIWRKLCVSTLGEGTPGSVGAKIPSEPLTWTCPQSGMSGRVGRGSCRPSASWRIATLGEVTPGCINPLFGT